MTSQVRLPNFCPACGSIDPKIRHWKGEPVHPGSIQACLNAWHDTNQDIRNLHVGYHGNVLTGGYSWLACEFKLLEGTWEYRRLAMFESWLPGETIEQIAREAGWRVLRVTHEQRPPDYNKLSAQEQWSIDRRLGILDDPPGPQPFRCYRRLCTDTTPHIHDG